MPSDGLRSFPVTPQTQLRLAMRRLEASLEMQARAVAGLRHELAQLGGAMASLRDGLTAYDRVMGTLAEQNAALHRKAAELAATP